MSKSQRNLKKLGSSCGATVKRVCLEIYYNVDDISGEIFTIGIELSNGLSVRFGCAGDGSVLIIKGQCSSSRPADGEEIQVRELVSMANSVLEEVEIFPSKLKLRLSTGMLEVKNADDALELAYNGERIREEDFGTALDRQ